MFWREALLNGLSLEHQVLPIPISLALLAQRYSPGAAAIEEDNYVSKLGLLSSEAVQRDLFYTGLDAQTFYWGSRVLAITNPSPRGGAFIRR